MTDENRLPPGQSPTSGFPILHQGAIPAFNPTTWNFQIWGAVEEPILWTWDQVLALPRTRVRLDLHCVTKWSKLDTVWEGISLKKLVDDGIVKLKANAKYVMQHADGGYSANLPLAVALQENFLMATHYAGKPLAPEHGYPLRGIIGSLVGSQKGQLKDVYLWKGVKWLRGLEFMTTDRLGFWETHGYHNEGNVWKEQRFSR